VRCDIDMSLLCRVLTSAVDMIDSDEELLDEQDRITGALQIGVVGCRRSASWVSPPHLPLLLLSDPNCQVTL